MKGVCNSEESANSESISQHDDDLKEDCSYESISEHKDDLKRACSYESISQHEDDLCSAMANMAFSTDSQFSLDTFVDDNMKTKSQQIFCFYEIIKRIPSEMPSYDRVLIIQTLKEELKIDEKSLINFPWHMIVIDYEKVNSLIQDLGNKHKMSYENIICPPVKHCIQYASKKELTKNHKPTSVIVCTNSGLEPGTLYQYRCRECKCIYGYDMYGQSEEKFFYVKERPLVKATQFVYVERQVMKLWRQLSLHSQVSFEALAVSYNSAFRDKSSKVKDIFEEYSTTKGKTLKICYKLLYFFIFI